MDNISDFIEILHRCRATLATAIADTPETLADPARQSTLEQRIAEITAVLESAKGQGIGRTGETRQKVYGEIYMSKTDLDDRPSLCRNRLRDEGQAYPRSGCAVCKTGGLHGCPYERKPMRNQGEHHG